MSLNYKKAAPFLSPATAGARVFLVKAAEVRRSVDPGFEKGAIQGDEVWLDAELKPSELRVVLAMIETAQAEEQEEPIFSGLRKSEEPPIEEAVARALAGAAERDMPKVARRGGASLVAAATKDDDFNQGDEHGDPNPKGPEQAPAGKEWAVRWANGRGVGVFPTKTQALAFSKKRDGDVQRGPWLRDKTAGPTEKAAAAHAALISALKHHLAPSRAKFAQIQLRSPVPAAPPVTLANLVKKADMM